MPANPEVSRSIVLDACRRLQGRREITPTALSDETGLSVCTCRKYRDELREAGLIRKTWRDRAEPAAGLGKGDGIGLSGAEDRVIQARVAAVRRAKLAAPGFSLDRRTLARVLPARKEHSSCP